MNDKWNVEISNCIEESYEIAAKKEDGDEVIIGKHETKTFETSSNHLKLIVRVIDKELPACIIGFSSQFEFDSISFKKKHKKNPDEKVPEWEIDIKKPKKPNVMDPGDVNVTVGDDPPQK